MKRHGRWRSGTLGTLVVVLAIVGSLYRLASGGEASPTPGPTAAARHPLPPIYRLPPRLPEDLRHATAVQRAVNFLVAAHPTGDYVLSVPGEPLVIPMDVAHVAIALVSVGQIDRAEAAMSWLYRRMTLPGDPDAIGDGVDYSGSWYDAMRPDGQPDRSAPRGRGESVGMALIATDAIVAQDPGYLNRVIGDERVVDLVRFAASYLLRPTMQNADGRFYHSPVYRVSFNEECARMTLGLQLASQLLRAGSDPGAAERAGGAAEEGLRALRQGASMSQGMAYDYYARSIWGLATPSEAQQELRWLRSTGLVRPGGVANWDWQLQQAASPVVWLRWWSQAQTVAPSQTFDYAIAAVNAGDLPVALEIEKTWLALQRPDGGFPDGVVFGPFGLHLEFGRPTSYAVARFVLLENLLATAMGGRGS